jgi:hypothetical protein
MKAKNAQRKYISSTFLGLDRQYIEENFILHKYGTLKLRCSTQEEWWPGHPKALIR